MILSIFGDESSDQKQERIFAVSGVSGSSIEWEKAIAGWIRLTKGEEFHAADWEMAGRYKESKALAEYLGDCGLVAGFSVALDLVSFREVFPNHLKDSGYYMCFSKVIETHTRSTIQWNDRVASDPSFGEPLIELEFTFDHRKASEGNAGTLYSAFINEPEWKDANILSGKISFDCRTNPRIQIADLVAREAMKELDRKICASERGKRESFIALEGREAFRFIELKKDFCEKLRALVESSGEEPPYWEWLRRTGRVQHGKPHDNYGNRFNYQIYVQSQEALEKRGKKQGISEVRSDNEYDPPSRPKSGKSCDGSGEEGQRSKAEG
jgi:hypothetical protein